jgi:perosamine synthetase
MKPKFRLVPRFHYTFRLQDLFLSIYRHSKRNHDFQDLFRSQEIYFLNSARAGLSLMLRSISKGKMLKIGIQPYNCDTAFQAIIKAGCLPVFIDINQNFTIDIHDLQAKKNAIDILILTHTFGIPSEIDRIRSIMSGKFIIEDCAHAFLSTYKNNPCGTLCDGSVFSMGYGKFPSVGHGGFVLINNPIFKEDFCRLYNTLPKPSFLAEVKEVFRNFLYSIAFKPIIYGLVTYPVFKKLDQQYDFVKKNLFIEAKGFAVNLNVFNYNFKRYIKINAIRKQQSFQLLSRINQPLNLTKIEGNNFYLTPILNNDRDNIYSILFNAGYECGKHFSKSIEIAKKYGYTIGSCPNAETIAQKIIVMPNVIYLSGKDMKRIVDVINNSLFV